MSRTLQFKRYSQSTVAGITGAAGELIIDTTNNIIYIPTENEFNEIKEFCGNECMKNFNDIVELKSQIQDILNDCIEIKIENIILDANILEMNKIIHFLNEKIIELDE